MDSTYRIGVTIKKISTHIATEINKILRDYDLTKSQADVLRYVASQEKEVSQRDIEDFFGISNPTVSGIVKRLEYKGLIVRENSFTDARIKYIKKTAKADALLIRIRHAVDDKEKALKAGLTEVEEKQLYDLLQRLLVNLNG